MSGPARLREALIRLGGESAAASGGTRVLDRTRGGAIAAMLREIDETILGRLLLFANDRGECIGIEAAGRRLHRLRSVAPEALAEAHAALLDRTLDDAAAPEVGQLLGLLRQFTDGVQELSVTATRLRDGAPEALVGLSAGGVAERWGIALYPTAEPTGEPPALSGFIDRCDGLFTAAVAFEGGAPSARLGAAPEVAHLAALAEHQPFAAGIGRRLAGPDQAGPQVVLLRQDAPAHRLLLSARDGDETLLISAPSANLSQIVSRWYHR